MQECIEHRRPIVAVCIDQHCHQQLLLCQGCLSRNTHHGHIVKDAAALMDQLRQFNVERAALERSLKTDAINKCQERLSRTRYEIDSMLSELEKSLEEEAENMRMHLRNDAEEVLGAISQGYQLRSCDSEAVRWLYRHLSQNSRTIDQQKEAFQRKLEHSTNQIASGMAAIINSINSSQLETNTRKVLHQSKPYFLKDRSGSNESKLPRSMYRRSTSEKSPQFRQTVSQFNHTSKPLSRLMPNGSQTHAFKSKNHRVFKPSFLLSPGQDKNRSQSVLQKMRAHSSDIDCDLTMKIQANRQAVSGGESRILNMIEEKRIRREQQDLFDPTKIQRIIQAEIKEALKKEIMSLLPADMQQQKNSKRASEDRMLPSSFEEEKAEQFLPMETVLRQITANKPEQPPTQLNSVKEEGDAQVKKLKTVNHSPKNSRSEAAEEVQIVAKPEKTKKNNTTVQKPSQSRTSASLQDHSSKKVIKKTKMHFQPAIQEIDENFDLFQTDMKKSEPAAPLTVTACQKPATISSETLAQRLLIIPELHYFLEENLKEMEEAWHEGNLMCWNRYFELKLENDIDSGQYLQQRKQSKKHVFDGRRLLAELEQNFSRVKITSVKKRKNLLVLQFMVMHLMALVVLIEGRALSSETLHDHTENGRVLEQLQRDELPAVFAFTSSKLAQLKSKLA